MQCSTPTRSVGLRTPGQVDRFGREIPHGHYGTPDFERRLSLPDRTAAMARHLTGILAGDPGARAAVFCVDAEHAQQMRQALQEADPDRTRRDPGWVARIVGSEAERDRLLEEFTSPDRTTPAVATTARLLSTGVDIEDLRYVVLSRQVGSMIEFKQIIGRGTRLYPPKGKQDFWVIDYVGASAKFADPEFDGPPLAPTRVERVAPDGTAVPEGAGFVLDDDAPMLEVAEPSAPFEVMPGGTLDVEPRKLYVDGQRITLVGERVLIPDPATGGHRLVEYTQFVRDQVRTIFPAVDDLRVGWARQDLREAVRDQLRARGVSLDELVRLTGLDDADPFDVVAHVAWDLPPLSRRERADGVRRRYAERIDSLTEAARAVVLAVLDRYAERGPDEISVRGLTVPPLPRLGTPMELAGEFGGAEQLRTWLDSLQDWLYQPQQ